MPKKYDLNVNAGDVLAARLSDGRFGAVHVIEVMKDGMRRGRDSCTLVTTCYLGDDLPALDDPSLRQVLYERRFAFDGSPSVMIADVPPPADFVRIGNFPPTSEEARIDAQGRYGGSWWIVHAVLLEWRWANDRDGLVREIEAKRAAAVAVVKPQAPAPRKRTPRSKLTEAEFWALVARVDADRDHVEPLIQALAKRSAADIREFHELLAHALYRLDARSFAEHAGDAGTSADAFLYARCYVVGRGKQLFEEVLAKPDRFPPDGDLESLLGAAPEAFLRRTEEDYEDDTHYSYETGSNTAGWPER